MIFEKLRDVKSPIRAYPSDGGIDFYIPDDLKFIEVKSDRANTEIPSLWGEFEIKAWDRILIPLGVKIKLPIWTDLTFVNKSWIAVKTWLIVWACLIDNSYRGELQLNLINTNPYSVFIKNWQKIIQWVIRSVNLSTPVEWKITDKTERWEGWFWSTWI